MDLETYREILPDVGIAVLAETLVIKAVHLCNLSGLVVAPQDRDAFTVTNLPIVTWFVTQTLRLTTSTFNSPSA